MERETKSYFGIFNTLDRYDENIRDEIRKMSAELYNCDENSITEERIDHNFFDDLQCERENLDKELDCVIVACADLGFWYGRRSGYKYIGRNINEIFDFLGYDDYEWYADKYDVRLNLYHHDGTHHVIFRCVKDKAAADRICEKIYSGEINSHEDFIKRTSSLRPHIAKIYGWKNHRHSKKDMAGK